MRPAGVLFDCDGVIVDSEPLTDEILVRDLSTHGLEIEPHDLAALFRGGTIYGIAETLREQGIDLPPDWAESAYEAIYAALADGVPLVPGVTDVMDRLDAAGIPYAVGSNGSRRKMEITLGQNGLLPRLEGRLVSAHDEGTAKPDPELYLIAARRIGVAAGDCVVIDDSPTGARAAIAAGMRCLGFSPDGPGDRLAAVGAEPVRSMAEVADALGL